MPDNLKYQLTMYEDGYYFETSYSYDWKNHLVIKKQDGVKRGLRDIAMEIMLEYGIDLRNYTLKYYSHFKTLRKYYDSLCFIEFYERTTHDSKN